MSRIDDEIIKNVTNTEYAIMMSRLEIEEDIQDKMESGNYISEGDIDLLGGIPSHIDDILITESEEFRERNINKMSDNLGSITIEELLEEI